MHTPVLLQTAIDELQVKKDGMYIDATLGQGGHAREISSRGGRVLALDWDEENVEVQKAKIMNPAIKIVWGNFGDIEGIAKKHNFFPVDGVLFDLGLSMEQIGTSGRGFTFKNRDELLDMRISKTLHTTAADLVNSLSAEELYEIFTKYSQEINSRRIATAIFRAARMKKFSTVGDLLDVIGKNEKIIRRIFQALRMAVNNEIENLKKGLTECREILKQDGRIVVISFNETEDRTVKLHVRTHNMHFASKKPYTAHDAYAFERSAKLRVITL